MRANNISNCENYVTLTQKDTSLSKLRKIVKDREAWGATGRGVTKSWTWLIDYAATNYIKQTTNEGIRNKEKMENGALVERNAFQKRQGRLWRGWRAGFEDLKFWSVPHLLNAFSIQDTEDSVLNKAECLQKTHSLKGKDISQILSQYLVTSEAFNEQWFIEQLLCTDIREDNKNRCPHRAHYILQKMDN